MDNSRSKCKVHRQRHNRKTKMKGKRVGEMESQRRLVSW